LILFYDDCTNSNKRPIFPKVPIINLRLLQIFGG
jgi:hypothetical protein